MLVNSSNKTGAKTFLDEIKSLPVDDDLDNFNSTPVLKQSKSGFYRKSRPNNRQSRTIIPTTSTQMRSRSSSNSSLAGLSPRCRDQVDDHISTQAEQLKENLQAYYFDTITSKSENINTADKIDQMYSCIDRSSVVRPSDLFEEHSAEFTQSPEGTDCDWHGSLRRTLKPATKPYIRDKFYSLPRRTVSSAKLVLKNDKNPETIFQNLGSLTDDELEIKEDAVIHDTDNDKQLRSSSLPRGDIAVSKFAHTSSYHILNNSYNSPVADDKANSRDVSIKRNYSLKPALWGVKTPYFAQLRNSMVARNNSIADHSSDTKPVTKTTKTVELEQTYRPSSRYLIPIYEPKPKASESLRHGTIVSLEKGSHNVSLNSSEQNVDSGSTKIETTLQADHEMPQMDSDNRFWLQPTPKYIRHVSPTRLGDLIGSRNLKFIDISSHNTNQPDTQNITSSNFSKNNLLSRSDTWSTPKSRPPLPGFSRDLGQTNNIQRNMELNNKHSFNIFDYGSSRDNFSELSLRQNGKEVVGYGSGYITLPDTDSSSLKNDTSTERYSNYSAGCTTDNNSGPRFWSKHLPHDSSKERAVGSNLYEKSSEEAKLCNSKYFTSFNTTANQKIPHSSNAGRNVSPWGSAPMNPTINKYPANIRLIYNSAAKTPQSSFSILRGNSSLATRTYDEISKEIMNRATHGVNQVVSHDLPRTDANYAHQGKSGIFKEAITPTTASEILLNSQNTNMREFWTLDASYKDQPIVPPVEVRNFLLQDTASGHSSITGRKGDHAVGAANSSGIRRPNSEARFTGSSMASADYSNTLGSTGVFSDYHGINKNSLPTTYSRSLSRCSRSPTRTSGILRHRSTCERSPTALKNVAWDFETASGAGSSYFPITKSNTMADMSDAAGRRNSLTCSIYGTSGELLRGSCSERLNDYTFMRALDTLRRFSDELSNNQLVTGFTSPIQSLHPPTLPYSSMSRNNHMGITEEQRFYRLLGAARQLGSMRYSGLEAQLLENKTRLQRVVSSVRDLGAPIPQTAHHVDDPSQIHRIRSQIRSLQQL